MRRLLRNTLLVFVLCAASISATVLVARSQPLPERLAILHLDQCAPPCWIGITPGEVMSLQEAETILRDKYPEPEYAVLGSAQESPYDTQFIIMRNDKTLFEVDISTADEFGYTNTITSIKFHFETVPGKANAYSVGDFHNVLGTPTSIWLPTVMDINVYEIFYRRPRGIVRLEHSAAQNAGHLSIKPELNKVSTLFFADQIERKRDQFEPSFNAKGTKSLEWRGFIPIRDYWNIYCATHTSC